MPKKQATPVFEIIRFKLQPGQPSAFFYMWVKHVTPGVIAGHLGVDRDTVHSYVTPGKNHRKPRPEYARRLIAISFEYPLNGRMLTYEDIYGPVILSNGAHTTAAVTA